MIRHNKTLLVSCGDSFTFGQGITYPPDQNILKNYQTYRDTSNRLSYTGVLARNYFSDYLNLGYPGASNEGIYQQVVTGYDKVKDLHEDYFFLVSLTNPNRDLVMTKSVQHARKFVQYDFNPLTYLEQKENPSGWVAESDIMKMKKSSVEDIIMYYRNDYTLLLKHIILYNAIVDFLKARNIKFVIFDLLNYVPNRKDMTNLIGDSGHFGVFRRTGIIDNDIFDLYFKNLENNDVPQYLNSYTLSQYNNYVGSDKKISPINKQNIDHYMIGYGEDVLGTKQKIQSVVPGDGHWNEIGHEICAELLADWIFKNYERE